jgi:hypothetical protein
MMPPMVGASALMIDLTDVPFSVTELYELLDFPSYIAEWRR